MSDPQNNRHSRDDPLVSQADSHPDPNNCNCPQALQVPRNSLLPAFNEHELRSINGPIPAYRRFSNNALPFSGNPTYVVGATAGQQTQTVNGAQPQGQTKTLQGPITKHNKILDNIQPAFDPNKYVNRKRLFIRGWDDLSLIDRKLNLWLRRYPERQP